MLLHYEAVFPYVLLLPKIPAVGSRSSLLIYSNASWVLWAEYFHVSQSGKDFTALPLWMTFAGTRTCSLALNAMLLANLVNQFWRYATIQRLLKV